MTSFGVISLRWFGWLAKPKLTLDPGERRLASPTGPVTSRNPVLAVGLGFSGTVQLAA